MKKTVTLTPRFHAVPSGCKISRLAALAFIAGSLFVSPASAVPLYWDTSGDGTDPTYGGDGTWDTSNSFWNTSATIGAGTLQAWNNAASPLDSANFLRGTSGEVTVSGTVQVLSIGFGSSIGSFTTGTSNYTLTGGTIDIRQASFANGVNHSNASTTVINSAITLFGTVTDGATSNRQRFVNNSGSLTLNGIEDISGFSGAGNHQLSLEGYSGASTAIAGNITKSTGSKGVELLVGGAGTSNASSYTLSGNNTGLAGAVTLNRGSLILNNNNALSGAAGLTVANANTTVALADTASVLIGTAGVNINKAITFSALTATDTSDIRIIGGTNVSGTSTYAGTVTLGAFAPTGAGSSLQVTAAAGGTTVFSNNITDGGSAVALTKVGAGTVNFTRAAGNNYDGGTTVTAGTLLINNTSNSGAGTGAVVVTAGTLGGNGSVSGAVTIGNGAGGSDAFIAAGNSVGTFTTGSSLSLLADATFVFELDSTASTADQLVANGVTLNGASVFSFTDIGSGTIALNTEFVIINNTSGVAIAGEFGNLSDGSTFTVGANQFLVDYSGGTGNDLSLTMVPEPSTVFLAGLGMLVVLRMARRTRGRAI